ncbi:NADPH-dependent 2,4-dienoyl-CoA reductase/sulfur reductase-like enzyme [Streptacidiphilus sp. MAP12-16]
MDRKVRAVRIRDLELGREYEESWDRLVLSPGAQPFVPLISGAERGLTLRDVSDADRLLERLRAEARSAVVVRAGFVGRAPRRRDPRCAAHPAGRAGRPTRRT